MIRKRSLGHLAENLGGGQRHDGGGLAFAHHDVTDVPRREWKAMTWRTGPGPG